MLIGEMKGYMKLISKSGHRMTRDISLELYTKQEIIHKFLEF